MRDLAIDLRQSCSGIGETRSDLSVVDRFETFEKSPGGLLNLGEEVPFPLEQHLALCLEPGTTGHQFDLQRRCDTGADKRQSTISRSGDPTCKPLRDLGMAKGEAWSTLRRIACFEVVGR